CRQFGDDPFPISIAEEVRTIIIEASELMGPELGPVVAEAARKGYWLQGPAIQCIGTATQEPLPRGAFWFGIWFIDSCHELCSCKPAALARTFREAIAWIDAAPIHEFEGELATSHERIMYMSARQNCLATGA